MFNSYPQAVGSQRKFQHLSAAEQYDYVTFSSAKAPEYKEVQFGKESQPGLAGTMWADAKHTFLNDMAILFGKTSASEAEDILEGASKVFEHDGMAFYTSSLKDGKDRPLAILVAKKPELDDKELQEAFKNANIELTEGQAVGVVSEDFLLKWLESQGHKADLSHLEVSEKPYRKVKGACADPVGLEHTHHTFYTAPPNANGNQQFFIIGQKAMSESLSGEQQPLVIVNVLMQNLYKPANKSAH
jgi:hypothetical protein